MFRDLLVHVDGSDAGRRRVQFAANLATRTHAKLSGLHMTPPAEVPVQLKPSFVNRIADEIFLGLESDAYMSATIFKEEAERRLPDTSWSEARGDVVAGVCDKARYADLVILGQYECQGSPENHPLPIAHSVASKCGRPVLVVPGTTYSCALNKVALVWDRSREAIRTIHDALPLLCLSQSVQVFAVNLMTDADSETDADRLLSHLSNHGIHIDEHVTRIADRADLSPRIEQGAYDLLVIGGSSNPGWVDFLFGNVTQSILLSSTIPVFVSH
jgi:nucleotide-binding universal stress UspA family protein